MLDIIAQPPHGTGVTDKVALKQGDGPTNWQTYFLLPSFDVILCTPVLNISTIDCLFLRRCSPLRASISETVSPCAESAGKY